MLMSCEFSLVENLKSSDGSVISSDKLCDYVVVFDTEVVSEDKIRATEVRDLFKRNDVLVIRAEEYKLLGKMIKKYFQPNEKQKGE